MVWGDGLKAGDRPDKLYPDSAMKVTRDDRDSVAVLRLEGEFDSFETELVRAGFDGCVRDGRPHVVFDLQDLQFANSTTIAYFITAQKQAKKAGGDVVLARPREFLKKTLETLGLNQVFAIVETIDDGVSALKSA
ncbi:MAG: STAS domain-containing protein [Planctomycetota bacterium]|nr:STAS domain-containing protein [Planctomycetota bacterium]